MSELVAIFRCPECLVPIPSLGNEATCKDCGILAEPEGALHWIPTPEQKRRLSLYLRVTNPQSEEWRIATEAGVGSDMVIDDPPPLSPKEIPST